ncbi:MAG: hypothetical protein NXI13_13940 [Proteobacteria bacterium]|nr:hypothetical protein [Pseudomonadota bacterium]
MTDITPFEIYLIMQADYLRSGLMGLAVITALSSAVLFLIGAMVAGETEEPFSPTVKVIVISLLCVAILSVVLRTFTPTTKTLIAAFGVPTAIKVADDIGVDDTARKSVQALNKLLDGYLESEKGEDK